jgi:hypothetical protein
MIDVVGPGAVETMVVLRISVEVWPGAELMSVAVSVWPGAELMMVSVSVGGRSVVVCSNVETMVAVSRARVDVSTRTVVYTSVVVRPGSWVVRSKVVVLSTVEAGRTEMTVLTETVRSVDVIVSPGAVVVSRRVLTWICVVAGCVKVTVEALVHG